MVNGKAILVIIISRTSNRESANSKKESQNRNASENSTTETVNARN